MGDQLCAAACECETKAIDRLVFTPVIDIDQLSLYATLRKRQTARLLLQESGAVRGGQPEGGLLCAEA
jgi:hypothetical protein